MLEVASMDHHGFFNNIVAAELYCRFLDIDGKKDWRLPTIEEVQQDRMLQGWNQEHIRMHSQGNETGMYLVVVPVRDIVD